MAKHSHRFIDKFLLLIYRKFGNPQKQVICRNTEIIFMKFEFSYVRSLTKSYFAAEMPNSIHLKKLNENPKVTKENISYLKERTFLNFSYRTYRF